MADAWLLVLVNDQGLAMATLISVGYCMVEDVRIFGYSNSLKILRQGRFIVADTCLQ